MKLKDIQDGLSRHGVPVEIDALSAMDASQLKEIENSLLRIGAKIDQADAAQRESAATERKIAVAKRRIRELEEEIRRRGDTNS